LTIDEIKIVLRWNIFSCPPQDMMTDIKRYTAYIYFKFDSQLLTMFTSSLYLAALVASLCAASVTRLTGRKWSMFVGRVTFLAGCALNGASQNVPMLKIG
jgi:MFS family permease